MIYQDALQINMTNGWKKIQKSCLIFLTLMLNMLQYNYD